uniref:Defective in cullin neddylation protein n=1 Tax=Oryza meridionalis TaxID=40149 RepID=A0A0E0EET0_9ORYZ
MAWPTGCHGFEAAAAVCPAAFQAYQKYYDIVSAFSNVNTREGLAELSQVIDGMEGLRMMLTDSVSSMILSSSFPEKMAKRTSRAVGAWRMVLNGRFRLLDRWCNFVEKYQRYNITEDVWQQLLAFSRCVNEDLEGYDPKGAWPVLVDDFVEHMHSAMESQLSISNTFGGINPLPGSKRKCPTRLKPNEDVDLSDNFTRSVHLAPLKRLKESPVITKYGVWEYNAGTPLVHSPSDYCEDANLHNPRGCLQNSPSIVEDCLSKGFEGCISMKCSF